MKKINMLLVAVVISCLSLTAKAALLAQYEVSNYSGGSHGLWAPDYSPAFFSLNGTFSIFENAGVITGELVATGSNGTNNATINILLEDFLETYAYKKENGVDYAADPSLYDSTEIAAYNNIDIDFFETLSGTIDIDGTLFTVANCGPCGYGFQFGMGANAKTTDEFGGSAWISNQFHTGTQHWDLNLAFTPSQNSVDEPLSAFIFGLGLLGLGLARKKSRKV